MPKHVYNLKKDKLDARDYLFCNNFKKTSNVPSSVDLRNQYTTIKDQGKLGACTAFSCCSVIEYLLNKSVDLSELYFYYKEREADSDIDMDSGSTIRRSALTAVNIGVCEEKFEPYDIKKFSEKPSEEADNNALKYKIKACHRITKMDDILYAVGVLKKPVLIGIDVYSSFENIDSNGYMSMPDRENEELLGGHAVNICGYFHKQKNIFEEINGFFNKNSKYNDLYFIIRNSWGTEFGDNGYCYMPAAFLSKYSSDWWYLED